MAQRIGAWADAACRGLGILCDFGEGGALVRGRLQGDDAAKILEIIVVPSRALQSWTQMAGIRVMSASASALGAQGARIGDQSRADYEQR
jgi:hypothetical protein